MLSQFKYTSNRLDCIAKSIFISINYTPSICVIDRNKLSGKTLSPFSPMYFSFVLWLFLLDLFIMSHNATMTIATAATALAKAMAMTVAMRQSMLRMCVKEIRYHADGISIAYP